MIDEKTARALADAQQTILFVYRQGSQPGAWRTGVVVAYEPGRLQIRKNDTKQAKTFLLEQMVLVTPDEIQRANLPEYVSGKSRPPQYNDLSEFAAKEQQFFENEGWHVMTDNVRFALHRLKKNNKPYAEPELSLEYRPTVVDNDPITFEIFERPAERAWLCDGRRFATLDKAALHFLVRAQKIKPEESLTIKFSVRLSD